MVRYSHNFWLYGEERLVALIFESPIRWLYALKGAESFNEHIAVSESVADAISGLRRSGVEVERVFPLSAWEPWERTHIGCWWELAKLVVDFADSNQEFFDAIAGGHTSPSSSRHREPDNAPNYWDLRDSNGNLKVDAEDAMKAVREFCK